MFLNYYLVVRARLFPVIIDIIDRKLTLLSFWLEFFAPGLSYMSLHLLSHETPNNSAPQLFHLLITRPYLSTW